MTRDSDNAERRPGRARIVTRRSFPRPGWTCVTRTRRPANSLKVQPRSWRRRRARPSSSTRSAGYLRCDRAAGVALSLDESSSAPGAARRRARWRGCYRPGRGRGNPGWVDDEIIATRRGCGEGELGGVLVGQEREGGANIHAPIFALGVLLPGPPLGSLPLLELVTRIAGDSGPPLECALLSSVIRCARTGKYKVMATPISRGLAMNRHRKH